MAENFSNNYIKYLQADDKEVVVSDSETMGLKVRVSPTGRKVFYLYYKFRGNQKRYRIGEFPHTNVPDARKKASVLRGQIDSHIDPSELLRVDKEASKREITLGKYWKDVYLEYIRGEHKVPESAEYILNHNFSGWMNKKMSNIDKRLMDKFVIAERQRGIGNNTINRAIAVIKSLLNHATPDYLEVNKIAEYELLDIDKHKHKRYLSADEESRLIDVLHNYDGRTGGRHMRTFIMLLLKTGLRPIELKKMEWRDVNWERSELTVRGENAKSGQTRYTPLGGVALSELVRWKDMQEDELSGFIFKSRVKNTTTGYIYNTQQPWKTILKLAKIENFRLYDLRHSFASKLAMKDVSIQKISHLLGHADIKITMVYAHLCPDNLAEAVSVLD